MLSVYICDDQKDHLERVAKIVYNIILFEQLDMELRLATVNPRHVLSRMNEKGNPGLYFLDIDLKTDLTGLELAAQIRRKDPRGFIVFITIHDEMAPLTFRYKVEAMDYINKDDTDDFPGRIRECMLYAMEQYKSSFNMVHKVLAVQVQNRIITLAQKDIVYIEPSALSHHISIATTEGCVELFSSIKAIKNQLDDRFVQCHKSCVVNIDHIQEIQIKDRMIKMDNGRTCTISSRQVKNLEERLNLYSKVSKIK